MYFRILAVTFAVILWFESGNGLRCFQCQSHIQSDCKEKLELESMQDLTIRSTECQVDAAEYCIKTTGVWGGVVGTTRFCSSRDMGNQCQYLTYSDHDREYRACTYTCKGDDCNSGRIKTVSLVLLISSVITAFLHHL